jgi:hypothetical protein
VCGTSYSVTHRALAPCRRRPLNSTLGPGNQMPSASAEPRCSTSRVISAASPQAQRMIGAVMLWRSTAIMCLRKSGSCGARRPSRDCAPTISCAFAVQSPVAREMTGTFHPAITLCIRRRRPQCRARLASASYGQGNQHHASGGSSNLHACRFSGTHTLVLQYKLPTNTSGAGKVLPVSPGPNLAFNRTHYGRRCKPGVCYFVHLHTPGLQHLPPWAG